MFYVITFIVFCILIVSNNIIDDSLFQDIFDHNISPLSQHKQNNYISSYYFFNELKRKLLYKTSRLQKENNWLKNKLEVLLGLLAFQKKFTNTTADDINYIFPVYNAQIKLFSDNMRISISNKNLKNIIPSVSIMLCETFVFGSGLSFWNVILPNKLMSKMVEINPYIGLLTKNKNSFQNALFEDNHYKAGIYINIMPNIFFCISNGISNSKNFSSTSITQFNFGGYYKNKKWLLNIIWDREKGKENFVDFFASFFEDVLFVFYQNNSKIVPSTNNPDTTVNNPNIIVNNLNYDKICLFIVSIMHILKYAEFSGLANFFSIFNILPFINFSSEHFSFGGFIQIDVNFFKILIVFDSRQGFCFIFGFSFVQDFSGEFMEKLYKADRGLEI